MLAGAVAGFPIRAPHCGSSCDPTAANAFERGALTTQAGWDHVATVGVPSAKAFAPITPATNSQSENPSNLPCHLKVAGFSLPESACIRQQVRWGRSGNQ